MRAKYFTPEEADKVLPEVENRLREVAIASEAADRLREEYERSVSEDADLLGFMETKQRLNKALSVLHRALEYLEDLGCTMKDLEHGLVDFPARRFGEEVWLCWRVGGDVAIATESEIVEGWVELTRKGFYVEPSSAVPYACLKKEGRGAGDADAVVILTGSGLKTREEALRLALR